MSKTVLITGASSGIGKATAELFAKAGWNVSATMRHPQAEQLKIPDRSKLLVPRLDVTQEDSIREATEATMGAFGRIDVLVNNAGYGLNGPLEAITPEQLEQQFQTNVLGLVAVTRHILPIMRQQKQGSIINISSIGGRVAFPYSCAYHATKFAVEGLSESLRFELAPFNIRVKIIEPGGIKSDFLTRSIKWAMHSAYEPSLGEFRRFTEGLNDRLPEAEHVAQSIFQAATSRSNRLRYPVKAGPYLLMHSLLPDCLWRRMVLNTLKTHAAVAARVKG